MSIEVSTIVKNTDLANFCESKLGCYILSIKSSVQDGNFLQLHDVLMELSDDSQGVGAIHISFLSKRLAAQIKDSKFTMTQSSSLTRILNILENLQQESRDYTIAEWCTKKIDMLDTFGSSRVAEIVEDYDDGFDIEKEFSEQWKCCIY